jgi:hypothetical protein
LCSFLRIYADCGDYRPSRKNMEDDREHLPPMPFADSKAKVTD